MRHLARLSAAILLLATGLCHATPRTLIADQSRIEFSIKEMGVSVSGRFTRFNATIDLDPAHPGHSSAKLEVDIGSLSTGDHDADAIALDQPWLDQREFPKALFVSKTIRALGSNRYELEGALSLRGRTRDIAVPMTLETQRDDRLVASGSFTLQRADFGIGGGEWNEGGVVSNDVTVSFHLLLAAASP